MINNHKSCEKLDIFRVKNLKDRNVLGNKCIVIKACIYGKKTFA